MQDSLHILKPADKIIMTKTGTYIIVNSFQDITIENNTPFKY